MRLHLGLKECESVCGCIRLERVKLFSPLAQITKVTRSNQVTDRLRRKLLQEPYRRVRNARKRVLVKG